MKKDKFMVYALEVLLILILVFALLVSNIFTRVGLAIVLTVYMLVVYNLLKKRSILSIYHTQVMLLMLGFSVIYLIGFYLMGIYFGFYKALITFNFRTLCFYIIPIAMTIISSEVIRSVFLSQKAKFSKTLTFISMVLVDLIVYTNVYDITTLNGFLTIVGFILFASMVCNLLYNYICSRFGYKPVILYRLITVLYVYFIPIIPDVYMFFRSFLRMLYPYIIYLVLENTYSKSNLAVAYKDKRKSIITMTVMIIITALFTMLISCKFRFGVLVIGSGSMTGALNKGDAVIFESYKEQEIEVGEVLIFDKNGIRTVHRVIEIKRVNDENRYFTKGDANLNIDEGYITDKQVVGISKLRIKYIGYPSIWVRDIFSD